MKLRPDLATEMVDGEMIVLDKAAGQIHQLNSSASFIWGCLVDGHGPDEMALTLSDAFDISQEAALSDVSAAIEELRRLDLVVD
jgi:hypothetical protein